jgi:hypothetical protein
LDDEAGRAQGAHRVIGDGVVVDGPNASRRQIGQPAVVVDHRVDRPGRHRQGQGVDGEVAGVQVVGQRVAAEASDVERCHAKGGLVVGDENAADVALVVQPVGGQAQPVGQIERQRNGPCGHDQVDVVVGSPQQRVAHRPADEVDRVEVVGQ